MYYLSSAGYCPAGPVSHTTLLLFMETIGQSHIVCFYGAETILITFHLPSFNSVGNDNYLIINYIGERPSQ